MNFPFPCPGCGHENYADWAHIGQHVLCSRCGRVATVPAPMETVSGEAGGGLPIRFTCPACGRNFATKPTLAGQKIRCNGCGAGVRVPAGQSEPAGTVPRVVLNANSGTGFHPVANVIEAMPVPAAVPAARSTVVAAADDAESDSFSLRKELKSIGGLRSRRSAAVALPSRAETMEQVRQEEAEKQVIAAKKEVEKAKRAKKKKKKTGYFDLKETLSLVAGVGVVVGALALLAWYLPDFRYPLGGLLCALGFIVYFLGAMSLRQLAGSDGFFKLMLYRYCPPYQLWFVLTRWEETQDFVAFFVSGIVVMGIGWGVIRTSPTFHRANASEREYKKAVAEAVYGHFEPSRPAIKAPGDPGPKDPKNAKDAGSPKDR